MMSKTTAALENSTSALEKSSPALGISISAIDFPVAFSFSAGIFYNKKTDCPKAAGPMLRSAVEGAERAGN